MFVIGVSPHFPLDTSIETCWGRCVKYLFKLLWYNWVSVLASFLFWFSLRFSLPLPTLLFNFMVFTVSSLFRFVHCFVFVVHCLIFKGFNITAFPLTVSSFVRCLFRSIAFCFLASLPRLCATGGVDGSADLPGPHHHSLALRHPPTLRL